MSRENSHSSPAQSDNEDRQDDMTPQERIRALEAEVNKLKKTSRSSGRAPLASISTNTTGDQRDHNTTSPSTSSRATHKRRQADADDGENSHDGSLSDSTRDSMPRKKRQKKNQRSKEPDSDDDPKYGALTMAAIRSASRKFCFMGILWMIYPNETMSAALDQEFDAQTRFENDETRIQAQLHDLYNPDLLDTKWLQEIKNERFQTIFFQGMGGQRSDAASRLRGDGYKIFPRLKIQPTDLIDPLVREEKYKHLIGWAPDANKKNGIIGPGYKLQAPILFKDGDVTDINKMFLSEELFQAAKALIWGPKAALSDEPSRSGHVLGKLWNLKRVTIGFICTICICVRWTFSRDIEFHEPGDTTKIPYRADWESYYQLLLRGQASNRASTKKVLETWNQRVFFHERPDEVAEHHDDSFDTLLAMLDAGPAAEPLVTHTNGTRPEGTDGEEQGEIAGSEN
ncbi:hypothetical protein SISSUDRAFT_1065877 [Sistotremastrum suecicum HHB10207 ss-3]|uniref:Uncharacterized protein n=1 Tax=Sistotremastrum suecicum HHB10207 ss-3 TaxID=1314776 RepID=A0A165YZ69_9AGAM|nr:hypothetical protein SISSUDRAFT_1065877 [Sistotremastrum suecicum HHB10207 ss-3]